MTQQQLKAIATGQPAAKKSGILELLQDARVAAGIKAVAGKYLTADRMLRLSVNAIKKTPKLLECDPTTVLGAIMASTALQLEPNTVQQQAFLIPYKKSKKVGDQWVETYDCQFQIGARGFITLAYRSPLIRQVTAEAIHENDTFEHELGSQAFLKYSKHVRGERGALIGSFCYVEFTNETESACILPLSEIYKIRNRSETFKTLLRNVSNARTDKERGKAQNQFDEQPWVMWEDDMATKSAIKKHAKQLPIAAGETLLAAAALDSDSDAGKLDLASMTDPDVTKSVVTDGIEPPQNEQLENNPSPDAEFLAEMDQQERVDSKRVSE